MKFTKESLLQTKVGQANRDLIEDATRPKHHDKPRPVGTVLPTITQHTPIQTLALKPLPGRPSKKRVAVVVTLIRCGPNLLDDADNLPYAFKATIDAVATSLGVDDRDPRIRWQFGQCQTRGEKGTLVRIETV